MHRIHRFTYAWWNCSCWIVWILTQIVHFNRQRVTAVRICDFQQMQLKNSIKLSNKNDSEISLLTKILQFELQTMSAYLCWRFIHCWPCINSKLKMAMHSMTTKPKEKTAQQNHSQHNQSDQWWCIMCTNFILTVQHIHTHNSHFQMMTLQNHFVFVYFIFIAEQSVCLFLFHLLSRNSRAQKQELNLVIL